MSFCVSTKKLDSFHAHDSMTKTTVLELITRSVLSRLYHNRLLCKMKLYDLRVSSFSHTFLSSNSRSFPIIPITNRCVNRASRAGDVTYLTVFRKLKYRMSKSNSQCESHHSAFIDGKQAASGCPMAARMFASCVSFIRPSHEIKNFNETTSSVRFQAESSAMTSAMGRFFVQKRVEITDFECDERTNGSLNKFSLFF